MSRRTAAEFLGTALLVMAVVGSGIMAQDLTKDVALQLLAISLRLTERLMPVIQFPHLGESLQQIETSH